MRRPLGTRGAQGTDAAQPHRLAARPVLSLGYFSLHEQREVTRSCEAGAKALLSSLSHGLARFWLAGSPPAPPLASEPQGIEVDKSRIKGFRSPSRSEPSFFARAKKRGPKRRFSTAEWRVNTPLPPRPPCLRHSGSTPPPGFFDETSLSHRKTACPPASLPSPGQAPCGARPSGGAKQCFAYFRRTHARRPCGVLSVGSVAAEGDPEVKNQG